MGCGQKALLSGGPASSPLPHPSPSAPPPGSVQAASCQSPPAVSLQTLLPAHSCHRRLPTAWMMITEIMAGPGAGRGVCARPGPWHVRIRSTLPAVAGAVVTPSLQERPAWPRPRPPLHRRPVMTPETAGSRRMPRGEAPPLPGGRLQTQASSLGAEFCHVTSRGPPLPPTLGYKTAPGRAGGLHSSSCCPGCGQPKATGATEGRWWHTVPGFTAGRPAAACARQRGSAVTARGRAGPPLCGTGRALLLLSNPPQPGSHSPRGPQATDSRLQHH